MKAQELLARFAVYGRFYEKTVAGASEQLRDRLEIAPREWPLAQVLQREPDLLVVMMNPGGSRPQQALWDAAGQGFVAAQPDRTQYQIMELLLAVQAGGHDWQHARVLNLSDLRTPRSAEFIDKLQRYAADPSHSLFSPARRQECQALFACPATPVLCAWGLNPRFSDLAAQALLASAGHPLLGLSADGLLFRHPLPQRFDMQRQWLEDMKNQVFEKIPVRIAAAGQI